MPLFFQLLNFLFSFPLTLISLLAAAKPSGEDGSSACRGEVTL
jgi:hypothetical protein